MRIKVVTLTGDWQYKLYPKDADTLDYTYPAIAPLVQSVDGDLTLTSGTAANAALKQVASRNEFQLLNPNPVDMTSTETIAESYHQPTNPGWQNLIKVSADVLTQATYTKIKAIAGYNYLAVDSFLQVWSFPQELAGVIYTGVLQPSPAANDGATLLFSQSIFASLQYKFDFECGLVVPNCVIAVSTTERSYIVPTGTKPTIQVEVEDINPMPV